MAFSPVNEEEPIDMLAEALQLNRRKIKETVLVEHRRVMSKFGSTKMYDGKFAYTFGYLIN